MILHTERSMIQRVAARWRGQYGSDARSNPSQYAKCDLLDALDPETATKAEVDAIIGNGSWTSPEDCSECRSRDGRPVVELGQEPDYESSTAWICLFGSEE